MRHRRHLEPHAAALTVRLHLGIAMITAAMLAWLVQAPAVAAQVTERADSTGTITGVVRDAARGAGLPFAVVSSKVLGIQRFSGDSGRFAITNVPPGMIFLQVRHLGYAARELRVVVRPGEIRNVSIDLLPLAVTLGSVVVQASRSCDLPGPPRPSDDSSFAAVFDQLRQNAEQYRILATHFPFVALLERTLTVEQHDGSMDVQRQDSVVMRSDNFWPYHPGRIVEQAADVRSGSDFVLHIPTLDVFADSLFLATHCFWNAGTEHVDGLTLDRIDFRVASSVSAPDVNGTMFLEAGSFQIRRSVVRLSHPPRERPYIDSAEVTTEFGEAYPSVPVITSIRSRNRLSYPSTTAPRASIELQRLVALGFARGRPGDAERAPATITKTAAQEHPRLVTVLDIATERALTGAEVYAKSTNSVGVTPGDGTVRISAIPDSGADVVVRKIGYGVRTLRIPAMSGDTSALRIWLSKSVELAPMVVNETTRRYISPALRGFQERRRLGVSGYFIDDSILRRDESRRLGDILRSQAPGVMLAEGFHSASFLMRSPRCAGGGPPQVYLDGIPLSAAPPDGRPPTAGTRPTSAHDQLAAIPPFDLSQFGVSSLAGVEYYPDSNMLPLEFNHTSDRCGALLLWTRER